MRARKIPIRVIKGKILGAEVTDLKNPRKIFIQTDRDNWEYLERKLNVEKISVWSNLKYHIGKKLRRKK